MAQQRRTEPDVIHRIQELAGSGYTGAAIERLLSVDPDYADRLPAIRTIQGIIRESGRSEEWWSVADASPDEARLVLPVLRWRARQLRSLDAAYRERHGGPPLTGPVRLANGLAIWIAKVRAIAPRLALDAAYRLALRYWTNPSPDLDEELAQHI